MSEQNPNLEVAEAAVAEAEVKVEATLEEEVAENISAGKTDEAILKLEEAIKASGNAEILDMVKQNQELFEIANSLLFRAVALAANQDTDVFIIAATDGVLFLAEDDYTRMLENSSETIKVQIGQHYPDADINFINEKYDDYVAKTTLKYINKEDAKKYSEAISKRFGSVEDDASTTDTTEA